MVLNSTLGQLLVGDHAEIVGIDLRDEHGEYYRRLLEMGFLVGERVEVMNEAPVSRNPISVRIKDATYALRREEANCIQVRKLCK